MDYRDFSKTGEAKNKPQRQWWYTHGLELAQNVFSVLKTLYEQQRPRLLQYGVSARLYGNSESFRNSSVSYMRPENRATRAPLDRITYNVVQSVIDTATSKIAKNKPRAMFLTTRGDYQQRRKAKKLEQFNDGVMYENDTYKLGQLIFRNAGVYGDGFVHVYAQDNKVYHEQTFPYELFVDECEAYYGKPRQLHRVREVDREVLKQQYPKKASIIAAASAIDFENRAIFQTVSDVVTVAESWHLPSGPDAKDGRHTICVTSGALYDEEWDKDYFPFAQFGMTPRLSGFFSQGFAEQVQGHQVELNKMMWVAQRSYQLAGTFKILLENTSKVVPAQFNNEIGSLIRFTGTKPEYIVPPVLPPGFFERMVSIKQDAFEVTGISQLSATSKKPDGLDSGKALREYNNIESERFMTTGQNWESFFLQISKLNVLEAADMFEKEGKSGAAYVKSPNRRFVETINWKDVQLADDEYVMQMYPVSSLPNEPAGRLQTVQEYAQAGYLSPRAARRLLDFPDLDQEEDGANCQEENISRILDNIVEKGKKGFQAPEPYYDLALAKQLTLDQIIMGEMGNLEDDKMKLLQIFNDGIDALMQKAIPPQQPQLGGGAPQANPQATPTSDLIPNVPGSAGASNTPVGVAA